MCMQGYVVPWRYYLDEKIVRIEVSKKCITLEGVSSGSVNNLLLFVTSWMELVSFHICVFI